MAVKAWMRILRVTLTQKSPGSSGKNQQLVIEDDDDGNGLNIQVSGDKYMSTLKDNCTVKISNLTYVEIIRIITGQFYNIKIECGYRTASPIVIFEGGVMYISNLRESVDTNTVTILCASHIIASYGQRRINLSFSSGVNMYSALNFVCKLGGIPNPNISTQFKKQLLQDITNARNVSAAEFIAGQADTNSTLISSTDCVGNSYMTLFNASNTNCRVITLNEDNLNLTNGFPRMTSDGLTFGVMPTFQFQCGDTIVMNNSLIQIDVQSQSEVTQNLGALLDDNGMYMITSMHYELQNRGSAYYIQINAKTRSRISAYLGKGSG